MKKLIRKCLRYFLDKDLSRLECELFSLERDIISLKRLKNKPAIRKFEYVVDMPEWADRKIACHNGRIIITGAKAGKPPHTFNPDTKTWEEMKP